MKHISYVVHMCPSTYVCVSIRVTYSIQQLLYRDRWRNTIGQCDWENDSLQRPRGQNDALIIYGFEVDFLICCKIICIACLLEISHVYVSEKKIPVSV